MNETTLRWLALGLALSVAAALSALIPRIAYSIGRRYLRITLLGVTVRRVALENIRRVRKERTRLAENWGNTFRPSHKRLVLQLRRGLFKEVIITPEQRYRFRSQLEDAIAARMKELDRPSQEAPSPSESK